MMRLARSGLTALVFSAVIALGAPGFAKEPSELQMRVEFISVCTASCQGTSQGLPGVQEACQNTCTCALNKLLQRAPFHRFEDLSDDDIKAAGDECMQQQFHVEVTP